MRLILVAVTRHGRDQATKLRSRLRTGELYRPDHYGPAEHPWEHVFKGPLAQQVPDFFKRGDLIVFFLAAGAVTRLIAPCLISKGEDPGVMAVDEAGRFVIPLLSGHQGGANAFARKVAGCLGAIPVITTASDVIGGLSPDLLAESFGWKAEPADRLKPAAAALVNREPVAIIQEIGGPGQWLQDRDLPPHVTLVHDAGRLPPLPFAMVLWITDRMVIDTAPLPPDRILWYRPQSLVLGVGCERGVSRQALEDGLDRFCRDHGFSPQSIARLASVDLKADEPALVNLAEKNGWTAIFFTREELGQVPNLPNPSEMVRDCIGVPGVAEPAAMLAAESSWLLVEKCVLQRMTFALARHAAFVARSDQPFPITFVGAGPGDPDLLTLKSRNALSHADVVVYAGSLVPEAVLSHAPAAAVLHNSASMTLEEVGRTMVAAARAGQYVIRLHSGDLSFYSAVGEQMALLDQAGIPYRLIPGISSFQAAAAALCRELTVPEKVQTIILTRGEGQTAMPEGEALEDLARHHATLAIFLSARRAEEVQTRLLTAYPPDTPVAIGYRVSWPDQKIIRTTLAHLAGEIRQNDLTRTTLIMVGETLGRQETGSRSQLYDPRHGHIFRARSRDE